MIERLNRQIIIITSSSDAHADVVTPMLACRQDITVLRIDTDIFFRHNTGSILIGDLTKSEFKIGDISIQPNTIWYRKPYLPRISTFDVPNTADYIGREIDLFWANVLFPLDNGVRWISHPVNLQRASAKAFQLKMAKQQGLMIPDTMITSDPKSALAFCEKYNWRVIAKSMGIPIVQTSEGTRNTYARLVSADKKRQLDNLRVCPTILQRMIESSREIRVTIIGERVFPVQQIGKNDRHVDIRTVPDELLICQDVDLPDVVQKACLSLVHSLGLNFSTIDILEGVDGHYYFLDLNPNGQWLWLDKFSQRGLLKCFVDYLAQ